MFNNWEEIKIPVPWGHVSAKWWGFRDVQPILALHGNEDNAGTFDTLAPMLIDEDISILSIDLPGHGFSSAVPNGLCYYQFWDGVILLRRIVNYFNWKQIILMGHSLGGAIEFLYAATFPDEVYKYISLDAVAPIIKQQSEAQIIDEFLRLENKQSPALSYYNVLEMVQEAHKNNLMQKSCEILMKRGTKPLPNENYTFSRDVRLKSGHLDCFSLDEIHRLALNIKCEVLNIRANPGSIIEGPDYYQSVLNSIKQNASKFEYHRVPGTHHVHLNNPERIYGLIKTFLKS